MKNETIKVCGVLASSANHAEITDGSVSPTLMARAGTGGNQLPLVAYETITPVAYAVENHPNDSRARIDPNGIVQTLSSRMGTGGNNTPMVLIPVSNECYAIDSNPTDSRIKILDEQIVPTLTAHISKASAAGLLVLIKENQ